MPAKRSPFGLKKRISPCHSSTEGPRRRGSSSHLFVGRPWPRRMRIGRWLRRFRGSADVAPTPSGRGADAKPTRRRSHIHANFLQDLPLAVLSLFKGLADLARDIRRSPPPDPSATKRMRQPIVAAKFNVFPVNPNLTKQVQIRPSKSKSLLVSSTWAPRVSQEARRWLFLVNENTIAQLSIFRKAIKGAYSVSCWLRSVRSIRRRAGGFSVMAVLVTAIHAARRIERPQVSKEAKNPCIYNLLLRTAPMPDSYWRRRGVDAGRARP
jgi:hypothetical protein